LSRFEQLGVQATGVVAAFAWAFGIGFALLWLINRWVPLRIDPDGERSGLNVAEHGASTEILDLLNDMDRQRQNGDFSQQVGVEPHTEIGQIGRQYNRVLDEINAESAKREAVTQALRQQTASLQLLQGAASAANKAKSIENAIQSCLESICEFGGWPVGHAYMVAEDGTGELLSSKIWHLDDPERFKILRDVSETHRLGPGPGLAGRTLASARPTWIADVTEDPTFRRAKWASDIGVKAGFAFPVLVGEEVVAVLEFFSTEARDSDETILEVMEAVGTQLGRVVVRARSETARFNSVIDNRPANVFLRD
jgi:nitrate/nitrite-specific signal transduction histidine kinase